MNSMRLLILLTFIVYETQCAPSIKPIKFLKSLLSKHFSSTTEQPLLEEEVYPAYKCEPVEEGAVDDAAIEWNKHVFLVNEKPVLIEVGNVEPYVNHGEDIIINPIINPQVNYEENSEVNSELNLEGNSESSPEKEQKNGYEKDLNTQWLLGENTSEKLPEIDVNGPISIKDKIINKINLIKSKLKLKHRLAIPIVESVEENHNNVEIITVKPITTLEPITNGKPVVTTVQHITTAQPVTTVQQYTTTVLPVTTAQHVDSVQYSTTVRPDGYNTPNVQVNGGGIESQEQIVNIPPNQYQIPFPQQPIYYSDLNNYPLWFNNCPPPLTHQICFRQNQNYAALPIYENSPLNTRPLTLENVPYNTPDYQNQKNNNNGLTKVINYIKIDATQPGVNPFIPNQDEPWIRYTYDNSKPIYQRPAPSYYIAQAADPESQPEILIPSSDAVSNPTSTMEPIVVYPADVNILPVGQADQTQPKYSNWNNQLLQEPETVNSNVEGSAEYPLRGDIPYGEDFTPNANNDQSEVDGTAYTLKERRHVGHHNNDGKRVSQNNDRKMSIPVSEVSSGKPVTERAETETPDNNIKTSAVTETKTPIAEIETPAVAKIENPVAKIETPAPIVTEIPFPKSNNVNSGV